MRYAQVIAVITTIAMIAFAWAAIVTVTVSRVAYAAGQDNAAQSKIINSSTKTHQDQDQQGAYEGSASALRSPMSPIAVDALEQQAADVYQWLIVNAARQRHLLSAHDARVRHVRAIVHQLIPYSLRWNDHVKNWRWQVHVIRSPQIRADCLLGGKIIVYSGIFNRLQLNDHEIAMLLSHQIAHALREHARVHLRGEPIMLDATHNTPANNTVPPIGAQLLALKYSYTDEIEADVIGTDIAARAGYDPRAAITLWQRLIAVHRNTPLDFVKMHPFAKDRIDDFKMRLADLLPLYAKAVGRTVDTLPAYDARRMMGGR